MIPDFASAPGDPEALTIRFREPDGNIESALARVPGGPQARAIWLMEALADGLWRGAEEIGVEALTLSEFDAGLAHLHAALYGGRVPCEAACTACGEGFEFALDLAQLQAALAVEGEAFDLRGGIATAPSGRRFRLPRIADLPGLEPASAETWLEKLLIEGDFDAAALEDELSRAGPVLSQDITAHCPDCGARNLVRFDMAGYLVQTLDGEAGFLWREIHLIAQRYGWGLADILGLTRTVRRQLAGLIVADSPSVRLAS